MLSPPLWCFSSLHVPPHLGGPDGLELHCGCDMLPLPAHGQGSMGPDSSSPPFPVPLLLRLRAMGAADFLSVFDGADEGSGPLSRVLPPLVRKASVADHVVVPLIYSSDFWCCSPTAASQRGVALAPDHAPDGSSPRRVEEATADRGTLAVGK